MVTIPDYFVPCEYEYITENEMPQAKSLSKFVINQFKPKTVIDIGCGPGIYVHDLLKHNVEAVGIDIDPRVNDVEHLQQCDVTLKSFDVQQMFQKRFDLAICLEVVEHAPEEFADNLIRNICSCADRIIFSAAQPIRGYHQPTHHNEQHKPYWLNLFKKEGYYQDAGASHRMLEYVKRSIYMRWFANNAMVVSTLPMSTFPFDPDLL